MAKCKFDYLASKKVRRQIKSLQRSFRNLETDLKNFAALVADGYDTACHSDRLKRMDGDLKGRIYKYDCPSSDLNKHPRESLRFICLLTEAEGGGPPRMEAIFCDLRKNIDDYISAKDVKGWVQSLRQSLADEDDEEEVA